MARAVGSRAFTRLNEKYVEQGKPHRATDQRRGERHYMVGILDADEDHRLLGSDQTQNGIVVTEWKSLSEYRTDPHREDEAQVWATINDMADHA
jgi:hypothetical protein